MNRTLNELVKDVNFTNNIARLFGKYSLKRWNLIPADSSKLTRIPPNGYTFTRYHPLFNRKPDLKKFSRENQVNYGVVPAEKIEQLLAPYKDQNMQGDTFGIVLSYAKREEGIYVLISTYRVDPALGVIIEGDGSGGGGNLSPSGIPPMT